MIIGGDQIEARFCDTIVAFCEAVAESIPEDENHKIDKEVVDKLKRRIKNQSREVAIEIMGDDAVTDSAIREVVNVTSSIRLAGELTKVIKSMMANPVSKHTLEAITKATVAIDVRNKH